MSNQLFAFLLFIESVALCVLCILYFFNYRREPAALAEAVIHALHVAFFFFLGGGVHNQEQAARFLYASALGLLFAKGANIVILFFRAVPNDQDANNSHKQ